MKKTKTSDNFVTMANRLRRVEGDKDSGSTTELWLVQVPQGFDVSTLNKLDLSMLSLSGSQTLKVKTKQDQKLYYSIASFKELAECKKVTTIGTDGSGQILMGGNVQSMLVVTESAPHCAEQMDTTLLAPKKPVPMPSGLKVRYTPFGSGTPCPSVAGKSKKKKKRKEAPTAEESTKDVSPHSRKRKRDPSPDLHEEQSPQKKKRKRKHGSCESPELENTDADEDLSPPKKKHKRNRGPSESPEPESTEIGEELSPKKKKRKSKHEFHESPESQNTDGVRTVNGTALPAGKHKSRTCEEARCEIDETDQTLSNEQPVLDSNRKHRKSKKDKEHIRTM